MITILLVLTLLTNSAYESILLLLPDLPYASIEFVDIETHKSISKDFPRYRKKFPLSFLASEEIKLPRPLVRNSRWILSAKTLVHREEPDSDSTALPINLAVGKSEKDGIQKELSLAYTHQTLIVGRIDSQFDMKQLLPELAFDYKLQEVSVYKFTTENDSRYIALFEDSFLIADTQKLINSLIETNVNLRPELELDTGILESLDNVRSLRCSFWQVSFSRHHFKTFREMAVRQQATDDTVKRLDTLIATTPIAQIRLVFIDGEERLIQRAVSIYDDEDQAVDAQTMMTSAYVKSLLSSKQQHSKSSFFDTLLGNTIIHREDMTVTMDVVLSKELDEELKLFEESQKAKTEDKDGPY